jgi:hypothetical protein
VRYKKSGETDVWEEHHPKLKCSKSIRRRDVEEPLHLWKGKKTAYSIGGRSRRHQPRLGSMENGNKFFGKTIGLEFGQRTAISAVGLKRMKDWKLWKGRPAPKRKKKRRVEREPVM